ncbi:hypothetical protein [Atopobium sp. oral taxon 810]|uniref:hypothetical protein n=1 Tax=Atopobium sp. oral taxon 810 TaxID=712158 RepID=UPI000395E338|nr:hypothetical protein [Atopobium sp. oral taxon 810]ERI05108.1 hypothetical protein HMPREF9069_01030 [Atopobium sp. oral taxon 810 str. F0209]
MEGFGSWAKEQLPRALPKSKLDETLLTELPNAGELTDEVLDGFLPWSASIPEDCRLKRQNKK